MKKKSQKHTKPLSTKRKFSGSRPVRSSANKQIRIETAVLNTLPDPPGDISFDELVDKVAQKVSPLVFPLRKTVSQITKKVQLDLEKRKVIERVPGLSPIRFRKKK
jgi:hypothetical protein